MKKDVYQEGYNGKKLGFLETLISASVAYVNGFPSLSSRVLHIDGIFFDVGSDSGMPAAYLTTPAGKKANYRKTFR